MKEYLKDNNKIVKGLTALAAMIIMAAAMTVITFAAPVDGLSDTADSAGNWYYYKDGQIATDVTTVAHNKNGWFYVENGKVNFKYTGPAENENGTWYIENGKVNFGFTGICDVSVDGSIFLGMYFENGKYKEDKSEVMQGVIGGRSAWWNVEDGAVNPGPYVNHNSNGWWYCDETGKVNFDYTGLGDNENGTWYCEGGKVQFGKTDIILIDAPYYAYGWYNIVNGKLTYGPTLAHNSQGWWYIDNMGMVDFSFNGTVRNANGLWYCKNGKVDFNFNGFAYDRGGYSYFKGGRVAEEITEVIYGTVDGESGWWNVNGGVICEGPTIAHNSSGWWYIDNRGKVDFEYEGAAENGNGIFYCFDGKVDFTFCGYSDDYLFVNGKYDSTLTGIYYDGIAPSYYENGIWQDVDGVIYTKYYKDSLNGNYKGVGTAGWWNLYEGELQEGPAIGSNSSGDWYIDQEGKVDFSYNSDKFSYMGQYYRIENGKATNITK